MKYDIFLYKIAIIKVTYFISDMEECMPITLRHVEVFHAIMTAGSLTKAAEVMRTSQPTLSRELATLERLLNLKLFERRSRRLFATEKALTLHAEVKRSYFGLEQLMHAAEAIRHNANQSVLIGCLPLFSLTLMPRVFRRILESEPSSRLGLYPVEQASLMKDLLALRYELGVVEVGVPVDGVEIGEVTVGEEVCVLPFGHPLAARDVIAPGDLDDQMLVSYSSTDPYRARFQRLFTDPGSFRNVRIEVPMADAICSLVQQGVGVGLVNPFSAYAYRGRGVIVRPLSISIPFVVGICRPRGRPISTLATNAASLIADECRLMADEFAKPGTWNDFLFQN
ncbi:MAG: LysR family transcriptional regulator [Mesorhizobium sp.]|nr:MAG: LysR family transcriptional regulator [Mesorhizobium sp.]